MSDKPAIVLLDVDGVLNAVAREYPTTFPDWKVERARGFSIMYSLEMGNRVAALEADIHWLTTWEELANKYIGPLFGWSDLPVVERADHDMRVGRYGWWKASAAQQLIEADPRPFVWFDDDLDGIAAQDLGWLSAAPPHLLVRPDWSTGITPAQLDEAERFLAANR